MAVSEQALEVMAAVVSDSAMRGAADWVKLHGVQVDDFVGAAEAIRSEVRASLPAALDEAKQALESGLKNESVALLRASMVLAGIRAIKRFSGHAA